MRETCDGTAPSRRCSADLVVEDQRRRTVEVAGVVPRWRAHRDEAHVAHHRKRLGQGIGDVVGSCVPCRGTIPLQSCRCCHRSECRSSNCTREVRRLLTMMFAYVAIAGHETWFDAKGERILAATRRTSCAGRQDDPGRMAGSRSSSPTPRRPATAMRAAVGSWPFVRVPL